MVGRFNMFNSGLKKQFNMAVFLKR